MVDLQAVADGLGGVILTDDQLAAASIADALHLRRIGNNVIAGTALGADSASGHAAFNLAVGHLNGNYMVDFHTLCLQCLCLSQRAGHAVQNEATGAIGLCHPVSDDAENQLVGNQIARVHVGFCFLAQLGAICNGLAEHIPGRNGGDRELVNKQLSLGPLSGAGSAQ